MNRLGLLLFSAVFCFTAYSVYQQHNTTSPVASVSRTPQSVSDGNPPSCSGKAYCITVYIAPWCGICKASAPTFKLLNEYLPSHRSDVGFGLVVGAATVEELKAEKNSLAPIEVITDDNGDLFRLRHVTGTPTWVVTDSGGNEILNRAGAITAQDSAQIDKILSEKLGL